MRLSEFSAQFTRDWRKGPHIVLQESETKKVTVIMKDDFQVTELYEAARAALVARRDLHAKAMTEMNTLLDQGH